MGAVRPRQLNLTWLDKIACSDVPPQWFSYEGPLRSPQFELLARCQFRCKVQRQCKVFQVELLNKRKPARNHNMIAGGVIVGIASKPHWRNLRPAEQKEFDEWCDATGSKNLLW